MTGIDGLSPGFPRGPAAPAATDRRAVPPSPLVPRGNGLPEIQPSLIWAKPLTVLSTYSRGFQGDLLAANGGFVAGYAQVDGRGKVLSLTPTGFLADPDKDADPATGAPPVPRPAYQPPAAPAAGTQLDVKA